MKEIIFLVEEAPEGGFTAKALGSPIFTEAESIEALHAKLQDAVTCHFDGPPSTTRLHFGREVISP